jgi:hypothetical protein
MFGSDCRARHLVRKRTDIAHAAEYGRDMSRTSEVPRVAPSGEARTTLSRRAAWVLVAAGAWTLYVWISRIFIMAGQDESTGFKVVHGVLAAISIAFGIAAGWIGIRRLRAAPRDQ